ncbi:ATP-dependent DNA helicase Q4 [Protopterus annectens]|uniref:ATP-dependent DNA helicase Q4 n=1 Tax=Protopterus annectens TaxID=7888 RepID=UPI001CFC41A3|nr:ATP-dependent DNA helicase Q4 [Protopterus annectens]XP_043924011.1 ATP-dependent DNA helicase Q4 [Protopterus annectens]
MDRYNELKVLLKKWETSFLQKHQRKPDKVDVEGAPEDIQKFYQEYRSLKRTKEKDNTDSKITERTSACKEKAGEQPEMETLNKEKYGCDSWGSHLSRTNTVSLKLTCGDRDRLNYSAQYFGMKLKSNLGSAVKERPVSLRKSLTPRRKENGHSLRGNLGDRYSVEYAAAMDHTVSSGRVESPSSADCRVLEKVELLTFTPLKTVQAQTPTSLNKLQQLRASIAQRMSSVNKSWLERCEGYGVLAGGKPALSDSTIAGGIREQLNDSSMSPCSLEQNSLSSTDFVSSAGEKVPIEEFVGNATSELVGGKPALSDSSTIAGSIRQQLNDSSMSPYSSKQNSFSSTDFVPSAGEKVPIKEFIGNATSELAQSARSPSVLDSGATAVAGIFSTLGMAEVKAKASLTDDKGTQKKSSGNPDDLDVPTDTPPVNLHFVEKYDGHSKRELKKVELNSYSNGYDRTEDGSDYIITNEDCKTSSRKRQRGTLLGKEIKDTEKSSDLPLPKKPKKSRVICHDDPLRPENKTKISRSRGKIRKKDSEEEGADTVKVPDKPSDEIPVENLFGEFEEEAASCTTYSREHVARTDSRKDGNFVRINLKKKSFSKGYVLKGNQLRKRVWKQKWQKKGEDFGGGGRSHFSRSSDTCFRCGATGHWAKDCKGTAACNMKKEEAAEPEEEEAIPLPTLEEVARLTATLHSKALVTPDSSADQEDPEVLSEKHILMNMERPVYEPRVPPPPVDPLYELGEDGKVKKTTAEVYEALSDLGYDSFRAGQEIAIMRILSGLSTLVVLSTGMGKSLCYQLPAYMYAKRSRCITLVISPLVSLMDDQVSGLPSKLKAVCVHSNMTKNQRETAIEKVKEGKVHVLLLSPEALVGGGQTSYSCLPPADQLPPVAFACIDEAHCVSEWSHNFRPCYLRLCKVLRDRLGVQCLLGLTATATLATAYDVARHLGIPEEDGIAVRSAAVPPNLHLSVSMDRDKDQAIVTLLKGERFGSLDSVIVYCTRREETTRIAALLRTCLQGVTLKDLSAQSKGEGTVHSKEDSAAKQSKTKGKKIRLPLKWIADSYHAGMSAFQRRRVQNNFMSGQLRIVVATVAFGMGLDKSDVRGIIHYNMPKSFESYVQEIGRAGRDGEPAQCHLFLDPEAGDLCELRRHIYADTVDYITIKKLVQKVFVSCRCREIHQKQRALLQGSEVTDDEMLEVLDNAEELLCDKKQLTTEPNSTSPRICYKHEGAVPIQQTVEMLDIREEGIETLMCYLELHPQGWVEMLHPTLSSCRIVCYGGPQQLRMIAKRSRVVAVVLARERLKGVDRSQSSSVEFDVIELADTMGWELIPVKRELRQLQWLSHTQQGFKGTGKSGVLVEFSNLSFYFRSYRDLTLEELDSVCEYLHQRVMKQEKTGLFQLQACFRAFRSVAFRNCSLCSDDVDMHRSSQLKDLLQEYFEKKAEVERDLSDEEDQGEESLSKVKLKDCAEQIHLDIRSFLSIHPEEKFTGRSIARIFHGIGSPCYPAQVYGRDRRYWRKYIHFDFNELIRIATEEIIRMK